MVRAMQVPALRGLFLDTLLRCAEAALGAAGGGPGWLELEVRRGYAQIRDAVRDDAATPFSDDAFEADVERLLDFARERSAIVREDVRRSPLTRRRYFARYSILWCGARAWTTTRCWGRAPASLMSVADSNARATRAPSGRT